MIGPDLIQETEEKVKKIRERLKVANNRQKSYADMKRKDIRYEISEKVFLKVSPWKKVMRFGKKGKLSHRFIGPYEVIEKVGPVAYRLALPLNLEKIHNVFHVCHTPIPGPTRMADPNRVRGMRLYTVTH